MNQEVTTSKALESIKKQVGKLTPNLELVIFNHLYLVYAVGYDNANKLKKWAKPVVRIDSKGNEKYFNSITDAAKSIPCDRWAIIQVLKGKYKQWKGYTFRYD